jgi:hypothetical protein
VEHLRPGAFSWQTTLVAVSDNEADRLAPDYSVGRGTRIPPLIFHKACERRRARLQRDRRAGDAPELANQRMSIVWETNGHGFYAATEDLSGAIRFYLVVEHGGRCHWSVWWPGESIVEMRHGSARAVREAMRDAEQAAP